MPDGVHGDGGVRERTGADGEARTGAPTGAGPARPEAPAPRPAAPIHRLNLVLLALYFAGCAWAWGRLPERIPIHFGFTGVPDLWADTSVVSWFGLPAIALALTLFLRGLAVVARDAPAMWSLPKAQKAQVLRLSPGVRAPVAAIIERTAAGSATLTIVLFACIQLAIYRTVAAPGTAGPRLATALAVAATAGILLLAWRANRGIVEYLRSLPGEDEAA